MSPPVSREPGPGQGPHAIEDPSSRVPGSRPIREAAAQGEGPPAIGDRPRVTRDRRERGDPHDPSIAEVRVLRPAEVHDAPPGRQAPARDAALRHAADGAPSFDFATGKERPPSARALPPPRSSPPPSAPLPEPESTAPGRIVGLKAASGLRGRAPRPVPGGPAAPHHVPGVPRRLGVPVPVLVQSSAGGRPVRIESATVDAVRESWLIEDRWWTDRPLRRRYWEVVTSAGHDSVVFRDLVDGRWYRQR